LSFFAHFVAGYFFVFVLFLVMNLERSVAAFFDVTSQSCCASEIQMRSIKNIRLLYFINIPRFFLSHRLDLAIAARTAGYEVHVASSGDDPKSIQMIENLGFPYHPVMISQHGINPLAELLTIFSITKLYRKLRPNIVHQVSIKPVLYGGFAAKLSRIPSVVSAMSGLGYLFSNETNKVKYLTRMLSPFLKASLSGANVHLIFQNRDDMRLFVDKNLISENKAVLIRGSGVDLNVFRPVAEKHGKPKVLFAGRLLWQKGLREFVDTAKVLSEHADFIIAGYPEKTSRDSVPVDVLNRWHDQGIVTWLGNCNDMPGIYAMSNIVCLPTFYGEGIPKVLLEASACERAIVATDVPGCREVIKDGENGFLVPQKKIEPLVEKIGLLIRDGGLRRRMGKKGRQIVKKNFTTETINELTLLLYKRSHAK